jgi:hypothetical protein
LQKFDNNFPKCRCQNDNENRWQNNCELSSPSSAFAAFGSCAFVEYFVATQSVTVIRTRKTRKATQLTFNAVKIHSSVLRITESLSFGSGDAFTTDSSNWSSNSFDRPHRALRCGRSRLCVYFGAAFLDSEERTRWSIVFVPVFLAAVAAGRLAGSIPQDYQYRTLACFGGVAALLGVVLICRLYHRMRRGAAISGIIGAVFSATVFGLELGFSPFSPADTTEQPYLLNILWRLTSEAVFAA